MADERIKAGIFRDDGALGLRMLRQDLSEIERDVKVERVVPLPCHPDPLHARAERLSLCDQFHGKILLRGPVEDHHAGVGR